MNPVRRALERFELTNRRHRLIRKGDRILLAVSGGPDSMAMLGILLLQRKKYALRLSAAYLDHGLQERSSSAAKALREACKRASVPLVEGKVRVRSIAARKKLSLEDAARQARYAFLAKAAKRTGATKIATAHHLDDQSETTLMRLLRGAGIRGLAGIPYRRKEGGFDLIRPLLDVPKKELAAAAKAMGYRTFSDPMNRDKAFFRSRVRHEALPYLRRINPAIDESLAGLQAMHADLRAYLAPKIDSLSRAAVKRLSKTELRVSIARLKKMHPALRGEALLHTLSELKGDAAGFGHTHIRSILDLLEKKKGEIHLPHKVRIIKKNDGLLSFKIIRK